jgi:vancomycin resistance protein YoaR
MAREGFTHIWSGFSTSLVGRSAQQRHNAELAGQMIDGTIIPPGDIFSFNNIVGARDREKGFEEAPNINQNGLLEDVPGGGICQLASTIYNAALLGGLQIVERHPHSRTVATVPPGRDATIASWRKDLKFKNPFNQPLMIKISCSTNRLDVSFRALKEKDFEVEIHTEQASLEPDTVVRYKTEKKQKGIKGFSTVTKRIIRKNGTETVEIISQDTYPAPSNIIEGGEE